jgi:hypothetical protein
MPAKPISVRGRSFGVDAREQRVQPPAEARGEYTSW